MNKTINVGLAIEQRINELGITKSEFGRRIGIPNQNGARSLGGARIYYRNEELYGRESDGDY